MIHARSAPRRSALLRWLQPERPAWGSDAAELEPESVDATLRQIGRFFGPGCYFGLEVQGWEHVPATPALFVSNHSGGTTIPDVWGFGVAWYRQFPGGRPLHPLAHDLVFSTERLARFFGQRGVLRASRRVGLEALRRGRDVMVMPGGDLDTWRPYAKRYEVTFGGRTGYARLALQAGVPIVPVSHAGAHETLYVITDGRKLARKLKLHALARASIFPVHVSLPWGLTIGPWPHIPLPARLRYRLGAPIEAGAGGAVAEPSAAAVAVLDEQVRAAVQRGLDELRDA